MSLPVSLANQPPAKCKQEVIRNTANFPRGISAHQFITYTPQDEETRAHIVQEIEELKEIVRTEVMALVGIPSQQLKLVDAIQRLGVGYHFQKEIDEALHQLYDTYGHGQDEDLFTVALWFRLLRQQGYNVSCDIFNKFTDDKGNFKECLVQNVEGMVALYEATHLRVHGEDVLEAALTFTTIHLKALATHLASHPLRALVNRALEQPTYKGVPRLEARHYISFYQQEQLHDKALLRLAKLDFNLLQSLHKKELSEVARWWTKVNFENKLPFVRDRVVESYFWGLGDYFEPEHSIARMILSKIIALVTVMDDIYDAYGTLEELELFTDAVQRWDINCTQQLPEYIKVFFQAMLDAYEEIEEELSKEPGRTYRVHYAIEAMKIQAQAYLAETKWSNEKYVPTFEEYMDNARLSAGYFMLTVISFLFMGEDATKDSFDWLFNDPKILRASSIITRLMDDIVSHKFEQERGHVASSVECYMKQHNVSEQQTYQEFQMKIVEGWKDLNQALLIPTDASIPLLTRILNFTRFMDVNYKERDEFTHVGDVLKDRIALLLIDPIPI